MDVRHNHRYFMTALRESAGDFLKVTAAPSRPIRKPLVRNHENSLWGDAGGRRTRWIIILFDGRAHAGVVYSSGVRFRGNHDPITAHL